MVGNSTLTMVPLLFEDNFFGEGYNGFDVMIQNLKSGHRVTCDFAEALQLCYTAEDVYVKSLAKIVKQVSSNPTFSSFKLCWNVISDILDRICNLHCKFSQEKQSLVKDVQRYIEEQQKSRKLMKDNESSTQDVTHSLKITSAQLQKAKELYHTRYAERQRMLRTDSTTTRDQEKSEARLKKAQDEYKCMIEKYNSLRSPFITKMRSSARHFQEFEQSHLEKMNQFVLSFVNHWSNVAAAFSEVHTTVLHSLSQVTTESSLLFLVEKLGTGSQEPQCAFFEDAEVAAAFASSAENGEGTPDTTVKSVCCADSCSDDRSLDEFSSTPSGGVLSTGSVPTFGSDAKRSVGPKFSDRFLTWIRRNSPSVESSQATAVTANGTGSPSAVTRVKVESPLVGVGTGQATEDEAAGRCVIGDPQKPQPGSSASRINRLLTSRHSSNATPTGDWRVAVVNNMQIDEDGYSIPASHSWSDSTVKPKSSSTSESEEDDNLVGSLFKGIKLNIRPVGEFASGVIKPMDVPPKFFLQRPPISSRLNSRGRAIPWVNADVSLISAETVTHQEPSAVPLSPPSLKTTPVHSQLPVACLSDEQFMQETETKSTDSPIQDYAESTTPKPTDSLSAADVFSEGHSNSQPSGRRCSSAAQLGAAVEGCILVGGLPEYRSMDEIIELSDQPVIISKFTEKSSDGLEKEEDTVGPPEHPSQTLVCADRQQQAHCENRLSSPAAQKQQQQLMVSTVKETFTPSTFGHSASDLHPQAPLVIEQQPQQQQSPLQVDSQACLYALPTPPCSHLLKRNNPRSIVRQHPVQQKPFLVAKQQQQQQPEQQQAISLLQPTVLYEPRAIVQQAQAPTAPIFVAAAFTETWSVTFHNGGGSSFSTVALSTPPPWQTVTGELTLAFPLVAFDQLQQQLLCQIGQESSQHPPPPFPLVLSISGAIRIRTPQLKVPSASLMGHCTDGRSILLSDESEACLTPPPCTSYTITVPGHVLLQLLSESVRLPDSGPNAYGPSPPAARPSYLMVNLFTYTVAVEEDSLHTVSGSAGMDPLTPPIQLCTYWRCERESTDFRLDYATRWPNRSVGRSPAAGYLTINMDVDGGVSRMQSLPEGVWSPQSSEATWKIQLSSPLTDNQPDGPKPGDGLVRQASGDSSGTIRAKFHLTQGPGRPKPVFLKSYQEDTLASGLRLSVGAVTPAATVSNGYALSLCKNRIICDRYVCEPPAQPVQPSLSRVMSAD